MYNTVFIHLDRISGAGESTRWVFAVHTNHRHGLRPNRWVHFVHMNHGCPSVRVAFGTTRHTGLAADAALEVDKHFLDGNRHDATAS